MTRLSFRQIVDVTSESRILSQEFRGVYTKSKCGGQVLRHRTRYNNIRLQSGEHLLGSPLDAFLLLAAPRGQVLLSLFLVLVAAKLAAELFERLRQPAVVG